MSRSKYKLSIVTPNYNSGTKLRQTCAAVAAQDIDYEHLIVDSCSKDGSLEIARELAAGDPRIKVSSEKDKGIFDGYNKGIAQSTGEYLYFLGAGDIVRPHALEEMSKYLDGNLRLFLYGDCMLDGKPYDGEFTKKRLITSNICHQGIIYGKDVFKICGVFDQDYFVIADQEHNMRCFGSWKIKKKYVPVIVADYEGGGNSAIHMDTLFEKNRDILVRRHFGLRMVLRLKLEWKWKRLMQLISPAARSS